MSFDSHCIRPPHKVDGAAEPPPAISSGHGVRPRFKWLSIIHRFFVFLGEIHRGVNQSAIVAEVCATFISSCGVLCLSAGAAARARFRIQFGAREGRFRVELQAGPVPIENRQSLIDENSDQPAMGRGFRLKCRWILQSRSEAVSHGLLCSFRADEYTRSHEAEQLAAA